MKVMQNFSVLMSLYLKERPEYFDVCMQSILNQSVPPSEIVIVLDGPITAELEEVLAKYCNQNTVPIKTIRCEKNRGLGIALSVGVPECTSELIARMDTDDIARRDRFEKQLSFFAEHPEVDICGSFIAEFEGTKNNVVAVRKVPTRHDSIVVYQKTRSAFNHVSVMFKRNKVLKAGNYENAPLMEDDLLWVKMIKEGAQCANIPESLVYVRVDGGMFKRRGGLSYFLKYRNARKMILNTGYISYWDYMKTICIQFIISLIPNNLRRYVFLRFLR